ncbi:hypothetical protein TNCV_1294001 [Trichonephila clavipes]|nr:hypothetical protein TNCV_1294001 [Trichonephila clavipes]
MYMTDENSVRWQKMYNYVKGGFPQHQEKLFTESKMKQPAWQAVKRVKKPFNHESPVPISILVRLWVQNFIEKRQDMRRMRNGSNPLIQMVYEACLRAEARLSTDLAERLFLPERPVEPERLLNLRDLLNLNHLLNLKKCQLCRT